MNISRPRMLALLPLALALGATGGQYSYAGQSPQNVTQAKPDSSPLIEIVRKATWQYKDINVAISQGFAQATPCVSGPDTGAMGVHYVLGSRITSGVLQPDQPEALIYEPLADGSLRLVGVEFIVLASVWQAQNPSGTPPSLAGDLMNYVDFPNRYGLPAFYELHVWAWQDNPKGSFADWNTAVTCISQPVS